MLQESKPQNTMANMTPVLTCMMLSNVNILCLDDVCGVQKWDVFFEKQFLLIDQATVNLITLFQTTQKYHTSNLILNSLQ